MYVQKTEKNKFLFKAHILNENQGEYDSIYIVSKLFKPLTEKETILIRVTRANYYRFRFDTSVSGKIKLQIDTRSRDHRAIYINFDEEYFNKFSSIRFDNIIIRRLNIIGDLQIPFVIPSSNILMKIDAKSKHNILYGNQEYKIRCPYVIDDVIFDFFDVVKEDIPRTVIKYFIPNDVIFQRSQFMIINVATVKGKIVPYHFLTPQTTILQLACMICANNGDWIHAINLKYKKYRWSRLTSNSKSNNTLEYYDIKNGDTILMIIEHVFGN